MDWFAFRKIAYGKQIKGWEYHNQFPDSTSDPPQSRMGDLKFVDRIVITIRAKFLGTKWKRMIKSLVARVSVYTAPKILSLLLAGLPWRIWWMVTYPGHNSSWTSLEDRNGKMSKKAWSLYRICDALDCTNPVCGLKCAYDQYPSDAHASYGNTPLPQ